MQELCCDNCNRHIGYMIYCGPRGWVQCDDCYNKDQDESRI